MTRKKLIDIVRIVLRGTDITYRGERRRYICTQWRINSRSNFIARTYPPCRYAQIYTTATYPRGEVNILSRKEILSADSIDLNRRRV